MFEIIMGRSPVKMVVGLVLILTGVTPAFGGERPLVVIDGKRVIAAEELSWFYEKVRERGSIPEPSEAVLRELLDDLVFNEIISAEGEERGYAEDPGIAALLFSEYKNALREGTLSRVSADVAVTEEEIAAFWEKAKNRRMYSFIRTHDRARAEEAYAALQAGKPWAEVVAGYSDFTNYAGPGGKWTAPMEYTGDPISEALFAVAAPGQYTPVVETADHMAWFILRLDKIIPGAYKDLESARSFITGVLTQVKVGDKIREVIAAVRAAEPARRDENFLADLPQLTQEELNAKYRGRGFVISRVGEFAVGYDELYDDVIRRWGPTPEEYEQTRTTRPDYFWKVWDLALTGLEDDLYVVLAARRDGLAETTPFRLRLAVYKTSLFFQRLFKEEFLKGVPSPTEADIRAYYDEHREDFKVSEFVSVYLVVMPKRADIIDFHRRVKGGADCVVEGERYKQNKALAELEAGAVPPSLPPEQQEWLGQVSVTREPPAEALGAEADWAGILRARVFPAPADGGVGTLSEPFRIPDGRWAFYKIIGYQPLAYKGLDDAEVVGRCRNALMEQTLNDPGVRVQYDEWLASLRTRHKISVDEKAFKAAAAALLRAPDK